ncbi:hypothetical protein [Tsukamurella asaccharolytica]|uniref:hypothetical protein n=1 Tax=Tsukamurella asaccharolytica TaxID=2592067 RepID=UPI0013159DC4|nr:hypothetical protein [Tsukamurella asaccharolytica]
MPPDSGVPHACGSGVRESVSGRSDLTKVDESTAMRGPAGGTLIRRTINHVDQIDHA